MRHQKLNRLAVLRKYPRFLTHEDGARTILRQDFGPEILGTSTGDVMFEGMKKGMVVVIDTFSFPIIGEVVSWNDTSVTVKNGVRVLYDGRHGQFAGGAKSVPATAEIEETHSPYTINADFIGGWGPYRGGKIPKAQ